ncbi:ankyrin repeat domain-containing protein [Treponema zioleckii]|uniref:ankyrin repeat domain-containing protein n=1 Tax=Treponema zioleckii TaxID=331680 RepID=UPI00168B13E2|nr:ankyrin repeat domain-containing protein [Treponema zioleckii]
MKKLFAILVFLFAAGEAFCDLTKDFQKIGSGYLKTGHGIVSEYDALLDKTLKNIQKAKGEKKTLLQNELRTAINSTDKNEHVPLFYAIIEKNSSLVQKMLAAGADPSAKDAFSGKPLFFTALEGTPDFSIVKMLAENYPAVCNEIYTNKNFGFYDATPLHLACATKDSELIKYIYAKTTRKDVSGFFPHTNALWKMQARTTPFAYLCSLKNPEFNDILLLMLKNGCTVDSVIPLKGGNVTPLQFLCANYDKKNLLVIKKLIERGADVDSPFYFGGEKISPLLCAMLSRDEDFVSLVLEKVKKIDEELELTRNGKFTGSALLFLCYSLNFANEKTAFVDWENIKKLVEKNADINSSATFGGEKATPLLILCMKSNTLNNLTEKITYFLNHGADVNKECRLKKDGDKFWLLTAFHYVARYSQKFSSDMFTQFKEHGGDAHKLDGDKKSAFDYITGNLRNSADKIELMYLLSGSCDFSKIENLDFAERTSSSFTSILSLAVKFGDEEKALEILKNSLVDWHLTDTAGLNSFDVAVKNHREKILEYFCENKIKIGSSIFTLIDAALEKGETLYLEKFLSDSEASENFGMFAKALPETNIELGPIVYAALRQVDFLNPVDFEKNRQRVLDILLLKKEKLSDAGLNKKCLKNGATPILELLLRGDENTASKLIGYGANLELLGADGRSAKEVIFKKNLSNIIKYLYSKKIPLGNAIFAAIDNELLGHDSMLESFLSEEKKSQRSEYFFNVVSKNQFASLPPVIYVTQNRSENVVFENKIKVLEKLLRSGYGIDAKVRGGFDDGNTALLLAAKQNDTQIFEFLLNHGARLSSAENGESNGKNSLFYALENQNHQIVTLILNSSQFEAKNIQPGDKVTLLMYFAQYGNFDEMNAFLPKLVSEDDYALEKRDKNGWTAFLYAAVFNPDYRVMALLRMYGANVNALSNDGRNAAQIVAARNANPAILKRLEGYGVY